MCEQVLHKHQYDSVRACVIERVSVSVRENGGGGGGGGGGESEC